MPLHPRHPFRRLLRPSPRREPRPREARTKAGGIDYDRLQMPVLELRRLELREEAGRLRMQAETTKRCGDHGSAEDYLRLARARILQAEAEDPTIEITADEADKLETVQ